MKARTMGLSGRHMCEAIVILAFSLVIVGKRVSGSGRDKDTENAVGRVLELEHELLHDLSNSSTRHPPHTTSPPQPPSYPLPPSPPSPLPQTPLPKSRGSTEDASVQASPWSDPPAPPAGTSYVEPGGLSPPNPSGGETKPWLRVARPPRDPRTNVGSKEFFGAVQEMHALGHPVESKFPSAVLNRTLLTHNITRASLTLVHLIWMFQHCSSLSLCPLFSPCMPQQPPRRGSSYPKPYTTCRSPAFHTLPDSSPSPRASCLSAAPAPAPAPAPSGKPPTNGSAELPGDSWNAACLHDEDGWWRDKVAVTVYSLRDIYVNPMGITFDKGHVIDRNGCLRDDQSLSYKAGETQVVEVEQALSLFYVHSMNFFHSLLEFIPLFISISPFLLSQPHLPLLMACAQWLNYVEMGVPIVGIPVEDLNVVCIEAQDLVFVHHLIQPVFPACGAASPEQMFELRRRFYLPQDGLPFFKPGWVIRGQHPLSVEEMGRVEGEWVVVLARRPGEERSLNIQGLLWDALVQEFGAERSVLFDGSLHILQAKALFNKARLYVAVHGAAISNIVFMPANGFLWEFRARGYPNGCYENLARICGLNYFETWGEGSKDTQTVVNETIALGAFKEVLREMRKSGLSWD